MNNLDIFGTFSTSCEIWVMGYNANGSYLDDAIDNNFSNKEQAIDSIESWAKKSGAKVEEVNFVRTSAL